MGNKHPAASPSRLLSILSSPLVPVTWSVAVAVVYALFPASDTNAVIAETIWIFGVVAWFLGTA